MSHDIKKQLLTRIRCSPKFTLQIDQSTYVAAIAQLLVSVRLSKKTSRNSSCSVHSFQRYTGSDIFKAVNDYFTAEDTSQENCISICTDRATAF
jgi:hypothetical protein